ncbi:MAG: AI-2E family transporter [Hyphomicrobiales bacterium]|nr:AI-2E family transporter [Hyphomicrobiales bacterium]
MSLPQIVDESETKANLETEKPGTVASAISFSAGEAKLTGLTILTVLAVVYSLYFGRDFLLPVVMAAVLNLLLQPLMRLLNGPLHLPKPIAAIGLIWAVFTAISSIAYAISVPKSDWASQILTSIEIIKQRLAFLNKPINLIESMLHSINSIGAATSLPEKTSAIGSVNALPGIIFFGTASTLVEVFTTIVILFFMLVSGDRLLRGLIEILPRFSNKRRAVEISNEIQSGITRYLLTITLMNAAVGIASGFAMWVSGLSNPAAWGVAAFCLNFIPILGPIIGIAIFFVVGLVSLAWPFPALMPVLLYTLIHLVEGETVTPLLVARHLDLNPVLVILSLFFWHAIWGIPGAFLAVPLLAILKIFADRIEPLKGIGHLIGA